MESDYIADSGRSDVRATSLSRRCAREATVLQHRVSALPVGMTLPTSLSFQKKVERGKVGRFHSLS